MAYHDRNSEGLTFSEWIQAAGYYKPDPMGAGPNRDCAPYARSHPRALRQAWRNGEDPTEYRNQAHGRTLDRLHREYP
jgi:hypothetical protein